MTFPKYMIWIGGGGAIIPPVKRYKIYELISEMREKGMKNIGILDSFPSLKKRKEVKDVKRVIDDGIPLFIDSGGYLIWSQNLKIDYKDVMNYYKEIQPNICSTLDIPYPIQANSNKKRKILEKNLYVAEKMYDMWNDDFILLASIQGKSVWDTEIEVPKLLKIGFEYFGLGGVIPSTKFYSKWLERKGRVKHMVYLAPFRSKFMAYTKYLKNKYLNDKWLHIYGVGMAPKTAILHFLYNVDSLDSVVWNVMIGLSSIVIYNTIPPYRSFKAFGKYKGVNIIMLEKVKSYLLAMKDMFERGIDREKIMKMNSKFFNTHIYWADKHYQSLIKKGRYFKIKLSTKE